MTPAARVAAAIEILDRVVDGEAAEQVLTHWARTHRFAGSGDRSAIRDLVFDILRCRRSSALAGGGEDGRSLMIGHLRLQDIDPATMFTGERYAPAPLTVEETEDRDAPARLRAADIGARLDWPDWLLPDTRRSLGDGMEAVLEASRQRAPVFLRVNTALASRAEAQRALAADGIDCTPHPDVDTALVVEGTPKGLKGCAPWQEGWIELQDASSQAVVAELPLRDDMRVLDLCAGGGGKTLAMAGRAQATLYAHDAAPGRMRDLPVRAARAGARVTLVDRPEKAAPFDLVLADVPCSGSGSWRRAPEGKWRLTPGMLDDLVATQDSILERAADLSGRFIGYVTCSVLDVENRQRVDGFLRRHPGWRELVERRFLPGPKGDGFYLCVLEK